MTSSEFPIVKSDALAFQFERFADRYGPIIYLLHHLAQRNIPEHGERNRVYHCGTCGKDVPEREVQKESQRHTECDMLVLWNDEFFPCAFQVTAWPILRNHLAEHKGMITIHVPGAYHLVAETFDIETGRFTRIVDITQSAKPTLEKICELVRVCDIPLSIVRKIYH